MLRNTFSVNIFIISDPAMKTFLGLKKENLIKTKVTTIKGVLMGEFLYPLQQGPFFNFSRSMKNAVAEIS